MCGRASSKKSDCPSTYKYLWKKNTLTFAYIVHFIRNGPSIIALTTLIRTTWKYIFFYVPNLSARLKRTPNTPFLYAFFYYKYFILLKKKGCYVKPAGSWPIGCFRTIKIKMCIKSTGLKLFRLNIIFFSYFYFPSWKNSHTYIYFGGVVCVYLFALSRCCMQFIT